MFNKQNLTKKDIEKLIKNSISDFEKKLSKKIISEVEKQIKPLAKQIHSASEKIGVETASKMLTVIKDRVERHVVKQIKGQVYKKVDVFQKDVSDLRSDKEQIEQIAITDPLTKVYNRRYFESKILEEFNLAKRFQTKLSILFFDIDHFKKFNDAYGHHAGDAVLRQIASITEDALRKNACLFRYGGEEFVAVLPETDQDDAMSVAERIRSIVEIHEFEFKDKILKVTVSVGVATYPMAAADIDGVVVKADEALYLAKNSGRNQVKGI